MFKTVIGIDFRSTSVNVAAWMNEELISIPTRTISLPELIPMLKFRKMIGLDSNDPKFQELILDDALKIIDEDGTPKLRLVASGIENLDAIQVSTLLLAKTKSMITEKFRRDFKIAVLTVPASFTQNQVDLSLIVAKNAGFETVHTVKESSAVALAINYHNQINVTKKILIYNFGENTFDVAIISVRNKVCQIVAENTIPIGGKTIDREFANYVMEKYKDFFVERNPTKRAELFRSIAAKCKSVKETLSTKKSTKLCITAVKIENIKRSFFEKKILKIVVSTMTTVEKCVSSSKLMKSDIDSIVLVGGSSNIPLVSKKLKKIFSGKKILKITQLLHGGAVYYGLTMCRARTIPRSMAMVGLVNKKIKKQEENVKKMIAHVTEIQQMLVNIPTNKALEDVHLVMKSEMETIKGRIDDCHKQFNEELNYLKEVIVRQQIQIGHFRKFFGDA